MTDIYEPYKEFKDGPKLAPKAPPLIRMSEAEHLGDVRTNLADEMAPPIGDTFMEQAAAEQDLIARSLRGIQEALGVIDEAIDGLLTALVGR